MIIYNLSEMCTFKNVVLFKTQVKKARYHLLKATRGCSKWSLLGAFERSGGLPSSNPSLYLAIIITRNPT